MLYAGCGAADVELETWTDTRIAECVCKVCRVYAETCQSSGGSGRRSWQEISQRRRAAAKKAGQNA